MGSRGIAGADVAGADVAEADGNSSFCFVTSWGVGPKTALHQRELCLATRRKQTWDKNSNAICGTNECIAV
eukprot:1161968-Pelagomonas_calceolata.AAC.14